MNSKEILERSREVSTWNDSTEKSMAMKALGSMLLARMGQVEAIPGLFFEESQLRIPSLWDRVFHLIGFHCWVEFDQMDVFDGTRRGCLVCGYVESSMMNRANAFYKDARDRLDVKGFHEYIKSVDTHEVRRPE